MGAYSTIDLTYQEALSMISEAIENATAEELADALTTLLCEKTGHNYRIID